MKHPPRWPRWPRPPRSGGTKRSHPLAPAALLLACLLGACGPAAAPAPAPPPAPAAGPAQQGEAAGATRVGLPVRLTIPAIQVDAAIEQVGQTATGTMDVPQRFEDTGWYRFGPRPGEPGGAVITGHVDSKTAPAVFWLLHTLVPGDTIIVDADDGARRTFVVTEVTTYGREELPLDRIFESRTGTQLNLITCDRASAFDQARREYAGLTVVYAELATERARGPAGHARRAF